MMTAPQDVSLAWRRRGRCAGLPSRYDAAVDTKRGRATQVSIRFIEGFCTGCPVRARCLSFGVETRSTGIFGGERLAFGRSLAQRRDARRGTRSSSRTAGDGTTMAQRPKKSIRSAATPRPAREAPPDGTHAKAQSVTHSISAPALQPQP